MNKINKLVYSALCLAILIIIQVITKSLGQVVTGSLVNLTLIVATLIATAYGGAAIAVISPFLAFMLGIGTPIFPLVPMIALGNIVLVLAYAAVFHSEKLGDYYKWGISVPLAALCKFAVLYFGIVKIVLPLLTQIPEKQAAAISASFGLTQLLTAVVGGALAYLIVPALKKAVRSL